MAAKSKCHGSYGILIYLISAGKIGKKDETTETLEKYSENSKKISP